ncbi:MAG: hypothetical protein HY704_07800 [Gemmatimonadetes bacterium]|nr:hypothetical protein [Gemmatimonadota bacterium]
MSRKCARVRRFFSAMDQPQIVAGEAQQAHVHLQECAACHRFVDEMTLIAGQINDLAPRVGAPAAVKERILGALARERLRTTGTSSRRRWWLGFAGVGAAAAASVALWLSLGERSTTAPTLLLSAIAEDHIRTLQHAEIDSPDRAEVREWLAERIPFAVEIPDLPDASLLGARLCLLGGERGAVLRYRVDGRSVSYYLMPDDSPESAAIDPSAFQHGTEAGFKVVAWRNAGMIHALVGDLPEARLTELAIFCQHQAHVALPSYETVVAR